MPRQKANKEAKYQMLRLPVDLLEALDRAGKASARSIPREAEFRLRESLARTGPAPVASPWVRAVTETVARVASEIDDIGVGPEVRFGMLCEAVTSLLSKLRPADSRLNKDDEQMMQTLVTYLAQKLRRERGNLMEGLPEE